MYWNCYPITTWCSYCQLVSNLVSIWLHQFQHVSIFSSCGMPHLSPLPQAILQGRGLSDALQQYRQVVPRMPRQQIGVAKWECGCFAMFRPPTSHNLASWCILWFQGRNAFVYLQFLELQPIGFQAIQRGERIKPEHQHGGSTIFHTMSTPLDVEWWYSSWAYSDLVFCMPRKGRLKIQELLSGPCPLAWSSIANGMQQAYCTTVLFTLCGAVAFFQDFSLDINRLWCSRDSRQFHLTYSVLRFEIQGSTGRQSSKKRLGGEPTQVKMLRCWFTRTMDLSKWVQFLTAERSWKDPECASRSLIYRFTCVIWWGQMAPTHAAVPKRLALGRVMEGLCGGNVSKQNFENQDEEMWWHNMTQPSDHDDVMWFELNRTVNKLDGIICWCLV